MQQHKQEVVAFDDVNDEIFDMVRPSDPSKITLQDLISWYLWLFIKITFDCNSLFKCISGYGDTVINILIDLDGFWTYENRETVVTDRTNQEKPETNWTWKLDECIFRGKDIEKS